jgi:hypothetical protein
MCLERRILRLSGHPLVSAQNDGAENTSNYPSAVTFYQDILTARVCNGHPLPCNAAGDCVSEEDAAEIFELGNLEFEYVPLQLHLVFVFTPD